MPEFIKVLHSFNAGDLITILPGFKKQYEEKGVKTVVYQRLDHPAFYYQNAVHSTIDSAGQGVCMNKKLFDMMRPLLLQQEYIEDFIVWEGQNVDLNYDITRDLISANLPFGSIHHWPSLCFPEMIGDYGNSWIKADVNYFFTSILVNRTERYQNPYISYFFLKEYQDRVLFIGTKKEHSIFCEQWKLSIKHLKPSSFLELAMFINQCKLFIGNQSLCWHLADAMKKERLLEICNQFPNTWPTGNNGYCFTRQAALEFYVNKLLCS